LDDAETLFRVLDGEKGVEQGLRFADLRRRRQVGRQSHGLRREALEESAHLDPERARQVVERRCLQFPRADNRVLAANWSRPSPRASRNSARRRPTWRLMAATASERFSRAMGLNLVHD